MSNKTKITLVAILALTVVIGATLAYLVSSTEPVENKFTLVTGDDINGEIIEDWDPEDGKDILPGADIEKRVRLKNTSSAELASEKSVIYGALQIWWDKVDAAGNATPMNDQEFELFASIMELTGFNNTEWRPLILQTTPRNGSIYMYNDLIQQGEETEPLFEGVKVSLALDNDIAERIMQFAPGGFQIRIEGEVVQGVNITRTEAELALLNKFAGR